jgi:hypothetical protein
MKETPETWSRPYHGRSAELKFGPVLFINTRIGGNDD